MEKMDHLMAEKNNENNRQPNGPSHTKKIVYLQNGQSDSKVGFHHRFRAKIKLEQLYHSLFY